MTGCSVSGQRPGSHFGLSLEPFSGGKPPLPSGRTCSQQVEAPPSTGRQVRLALLLGPSSPSPPQEIERTAARLARRTVVQIARCCTLLSPQRNIPRSGSAGSLQPDRPLVAPVRLWRQLPARSRLSP